MILLTRRLSNRAPVRPVGFGRVRPAQLDLSWADIIYIVVMLLGIVGKALWDNLNSSNHTAGITSWELLAAIIVSPIVYANVQQRFLNDTVSLPGIALAFQNGFFWQALFQTAQAQQGPMPGH